MPTHPPDPAILHLLPQVTCPRLHVSSPCTSPPVLLLAGVDALLLRLRWASPLFSWQSPLQSLQPLRIKAPPHPSLEEEAGALRPRRSPLFGRLGNFKLETAKDLKLDWLGISPVGLPQVAQLA